MFGTLLEDKTTVLFQGDSITDAHRNRDILDDLGSGYPSLIGAWYSALYAEKAVRFINRGISGNRVKDLRARWQADCLDLQPDWVSILIGVNDTWRRYDSNDPTTADAFERDYRAIIESTQQTLNARIILMEPFLLPVQEGQQRWREDLDPKIAVVRKLAREYKTMFIPLDGIFAEAATRLDPKHWAEDGVHPTRTGHALIAQAWLRAVKAI
ncbi:MAG TPA: SGNH/GDSL hydrolase family protein [Anaerolineaceae bacterium]